MIFPFKFSIYQHTNFLNFSLLLFFLIFILSLIPLAKEASQWLVGLGSQLGLAHECRNWKGARIVRQRNPEKSERHKLGLTWVENKMERNGSGSTRRRQKAWGCGYRGWMEKLRAIKALPPAEPWIDSTVLNPPFPCKSGGEWSTPSPCRVGWGSRRGLLAVPLLPQEVTEVCAEPNGSCSDDDSLGCHRDATRPSFLCWGHSSDFLFVVVNYRIETATKRQGYSGKHQVLQLTGCATWIPLCSCHNHHHQHPSILWS